MNNPNFVENKNNEAGNSKISGQTQQGSSESVTRITEIALLTGATDASGKPSIQGSQPSKSEQDKVTNTVNNGKSTETGLGNGKTMGSETKLLPIGTITTSEPVARTIEESTNKGANIGTSTEKQNTSWRNPEGLQRLSERAKVKKIKTQRICTQ